MFLLTNQQRECFALAPIQAHWECIEAKPGPYDIYKTLLYLDGDTVVKCIMSGEDYYNEYELSEMVSPDRKTLLPKTQRGKPVLLSSSTIQKRNGIGMRLFYHNKRLHLYNLSSRCSYFYNSNMNDDICDLEHFIQWVDNWCNETTAADKKDIFRFSQQGRRHVRYREGDVFRFRIDRRLYGYGRILLDYDMMRKKKEPFWDILMSKPVVCSVYHILTDRDDITADELKHFGSLPSTIITDNCLFYGEYEVIGNLPITEHEDYPIMYGYSICLGENALCYQCGKTFRKVNNGTALYSGFINNGVSFNLNFTKDVLLQCVNEASNAPYWTNYYTHKVERDLRNPKHADKLQKIKEQFGL